MEREKALKLLKESLQSQNLIKHSLAVEAAMRELARHFNEDEETWALCGLLHDLDYEKTKEDFASHSKIAAAELKALGVDGTICQAVLTHNYIHGLEPESLMAKALYCVDGLTCT